MKEYNYSYNDDTRELTIYEDNCVLATISDWEWVLRSTKKKNSLKPEKELLLMVIRGGLFTINLVINTVLFFASASIKRRKSVRLQ